MSDEPKKKRRFPAVIDLTSKAQEAAKVAANPPAPAETTDPDALDTSLDALPEAAQAAARSAGWMQTMPVQARTMPYLLDGKDVIVQSKTGSGKTGAFLLPLFARLDPARRGAQRPLLAFQPAAGDRPRLRDGLPQRLGRAGGLTPWRFSISRPATTASFPMSFSIRAASRPCRATISSG